MIIKAGYDKDKNIKAINIMHHEINELIGSYTYEYDGDYKNFRKLGSKKVVARNYNGFKRYLKITGNSKDANNLINELMICNNIDA